MAAYDEQRKLGVLRTPSLLIPEIEQEKEKENEALCIGSGACISYNNCDKMFFCGFIGGTECSARVWRHIYDQE